LASAREFACEFEERPIPNRRAHVDAIRLLKEQHDEVESLFKKFEKSDDLNEKGQLFTKITDMLAAHATIEEKVFYPVAYRAGEQEDDEDLEDMLREAVEEHLAMKRIIADLVDMQPGDDNFVAKMKVLREEVEHHVEEEEGELFPQARKEIDSVELEEMGVEMKEMFDALVPFEPRMDAAKETDEAAPLE
jgi:hemerythrin-like domain-containing protein